MKIFLTSRLAIQAWATSLLGVLHIPAALQALRLRRERFETSFLISQAESMLGLPTAMDRLLTSVTVRRATHFALFLVCSYLMMRSGTAFAQIAAKPISGLASGTWSETATAALTTIGMVCQGVGVAYGYKGVTSLKGITDQNTRDATPSSAGLTILSSAGLIGLPEVIGYGTGSLLGSGAKMTAIGTTGGGFK